MWWNGPYDGMGQWMGWGWWMPFHGILSLLLLILVVVGIVALIRFLFNGRGRGVPGHGRSPGLEVLEERYAKGEIQRDEYLQKKRDLGG
jgi:putative membrane protein